MAKTYLATKEDLTPINNQVTQLQNDKLSIEDRDVITIASYDDLDALFEGD